MGGNQAETHGTILLLLIFIISHYFMQSIVLRMQNDIERIQSNCNSEVDAEKIKELKEKMRQTKVFLR
jgi:hypothetical protein